MTQKSDGDLTRFFKPRSLAIVGASNDLVKPGGRLMDYALRYSKGIEIYPVNPNRPEVMGKRAYPALTDIPGEVDVACIAVPQTGVLQSVKDCGTKGVKYAIVFTSGFAELGNKEAERALVESARGGGTRLLGPNCQGAISPASGYIASYHSCLEKQPVKGKVGLLTQSGALGGYLCGAFWERGIGTSHFVSVGNGSDLAIEELLGYYAGDRDTRIAALFLEGIRDGNAFRKAAESLRSAEKPLLVMKTGKSQVGQASALTHTGSIAGSDAVYDAVFKQVGAVRVARIGELIDAVNALAWQPLPRGNRAAFLSPSGAACALVADLSEDLGLEVADLSPKTLEAMKKSLPDVAVAKNPLDVVYVYGNPNARTMVGDLIETMAEDESVDVIIPGLTISTKIGMEIAEYAFAKSQRVVSEMKKPILWWWATDYDSFGQMRKAFALKGFPLYPSPEQAVDAAVIMARCAKAVKRR